MIKLKPIDKKGRIIHKNDWIRITEMPKFISKMPKCTKRIFKKSIGKTFKVESFDKYGYLELDVWK
jgi:hypothetical protein